MKKAIVLFCAIMVVVASLTSCKVKSRSYIKYREHPRYRVN